MAKIFSDEVTNTFPPTTLKNWAFFKLFRDCTRMRGRDIASYNNNDNNDNDIDDIFIAHFLQKQSTTDYKNYNKYKVESIYSHYGIKDENYTTNNLLTI